MTAHDLHELGSKLDVSAKPLEGRGGGANTHFNALQDSREHTSFILCSSLKICVFADLRLDTYSLTLSLIQPQRTLVGIMQNVVTSLSDTTGALWLQRIVQAIESGGLDCISIFCTKGRHRSVSAAEVLRARFYPRAHVEHLTITRKRRERISDHPMTK